MVPATLLNTACLYALQCHDHDAADDVADANDDADADADGAAALMVMTILLMMMH